MRHACSIVSNKRMVPHFVNRSNGDLPCFFEHSMCLCSEGEADDRNKRKLPFPRGILLAQHNSKKNGLDDQKGRAGRKQGVGIMSYY